MNALADHLWQSTALAAGLALLAVAFRRNRASVRYWLWFVASVKFLVPLSAVAAFGRQVTWRPAPRMAPPEVFRVVETASRPFSHQQWFVAPAAAPSSSFDSAALLLFVWIAGAVVVLLVWSFHWRRVRAIVREASPLMAGREVRILRRVEQRTALRPLTLVSSEASLEPGLIGILSPVLVWPRVMTDRLDDEQIEAIMAHEVCHVRRRDNLLASIHMLVEAVFWFHPLVWWVGARLVEERERACDEGVLTLGCEPVVYARSILKTCEVCLESPVINVAGVTGADLKERIAAIVGRRIGRDLSTSRRLLLMAALIAAVAVPVVADLAQSPDQELSFEVASVKANKSPDMRVSIMTQPGGGMTATGVPLRLLIQIAYQIQPFQLVDPPDWIGVERFDVVAKAGRESPQPGAGGGPEVWHSMLRSLLADRFKLVIRRDTREMPIYALVLARSDGRLGPQLGPSASNCEAERGARPPADKKEIPPPQPGERPPCGIRMSPGELSGGGFPISRIAMVLSQFVQRTVVDRTGLRGNYDLDLKWTPDQIPRGTPPPGAPPLPDIDPNGPSIFTAVQEQLGLKLESQRGPIDVLVIERVERPTPD